MSDTNDLLDDVWGSDSESEVLTDNNVHLTQDLKKLREQHNKRGYLDGIVSSKETNLQQGFNDGFPTGAELGFKVGKLIGILQILNYKYGDKDEQLKQDYKTAIQELRIGNMLSKHVFDTDYQLPEDGKHSILENWNLKVNSYCEKYHINKT